MLIGIPGVPPIDETAAHDQSVIEAMVPDFQCCLDRALRADRTNVKDGARLELRVGGGVSVRGGDGIHPESISCISGRLRTFAPAHVVELPMMVRVSP